MEVFKVELLILDLDEVGEEGVRELLENTHYPNRAISPKVKKIETREVEWDDKHPLNLRDTADQAYQELFNLEK